MSELVELENTDTLLGESSLEGKGSEDLKKMIENTQASPEQEVEEVEEVGELEAEETAEPAAIPQEEEQTKEPATSSESEYRKGVQDVLEQLKGQFNQTKQTSEPQKKASAEETLEHFTQDPEGFLTNLIESKMTPHRQELSKVEERTIRSNARRANPDFARLEPVVDKIQEMHPSLVSGKSVSETIEVYYLIAKGMEAQENEKKSQSSKDKETRNRQASKLSASSLPKGSRKTVSSGDDKAFHKLSAKDMRKRISEMTGGR